MASLSVDVRPDRRTLRPLPSNLLRRLEKVLEASEPLFDAQVRRRAPRRLLAGNHGPATGRHGARTGPTTQQDHGAEPTATSAPTAVQPGSPVSRLSRDGTDLGWPLRVAADEQRQVGGLHATGTRVGGDAGAGDAAPDGPAWAVRCEAVDPAERRTGVPRSVRHTRWITESTGRESSRPRTGASCSPPSPGRPGGQPCAHGATVGERSWTAAGATPCRTRTYLGQTAPRHRTRRPAASTGRGRPRCTLRPPTPASAPARRRSSPQSAHPSLCSSLWPPAAGAGPFDGDAAGELGADAFGDRRSGVEQLFSVAPAKVEGCAASGVAGGVAGIMSTVNTARCQQVQQRPRSR